MATTIGRTYCRMIHSICAIENLRLSWYPAVYHGQTSPASQEGVFRSAWCRSFFSSDQSASDEVVHDSKLAQAKKTAGPQKPKRPPPVFLMFVHSIKDDLRKANPDIKHSEIFGEASRRWQEMDPEEKSRLTLERRELNEKYKADQISYVENMTPEQIQEEEEEKQRKAVKKLKKTRKELGMPKKPLSPYSWFMADRMRALHRTEAAQEEEEEEEERKQRHLNFFKQIKDEWNALSKEDLEVYYNKSRASNAQYHSQMAAWEESMIRSGRFDVLRVPTLRKLKHGPKGKKSRKKSEVTE